MYMSKDENGIIAFSDFEIDPTRGELRRNGTAVTVEPQVLDVIAYFASNPGKLLSRDDLIAGVWGGRAISDSAISSRINAARVALGDDGTTQRYIRTIPRRGFRFQAEIIAAEARPRATLSEKPSIAVLPFQNLSDDPSQTYFSDGIADDIITDLSRYNELFVIARHSSFLYRDPAIPTKQIANELGVQYLAEGSVRRAGSRIRVSIQLFDPWVGNQLWAERYDRDVEDIFAVQDEITAMIVSRLVGQISRQHYLRVQTKRPEAVIAYDHVLKAFEHATKVSPDHNAIALTEVGQAIESDPTFARAYAIQAMAYINEGNNFWTDDPAAAFAHGYEAAQKAVAADNRDPWGHAMLGIAELWHHRAHDRAVADMRHALHLNPNNAHIRGLFAYLLAFVKELEMALAEIETAIHLDPHFPAMFHGFKGRALLLLRRFDEAMACLDQMVTLMPGHSNALAYAAVCHAAAGNRKKAGDLVSQLRTSNPNYRTGVLQRFLPFIDPSDRDFIVEMLRISGLPE